MFCPPSFWSQELCDVSSLGFTSRLETGKDRLAMSGLVTFFEIFYLINRHFLKKVQYFQSEAVTVPLTTCLQIHMKLIRTPPSKCELQCKTQRSTGNAHWLQCTFQCSVQLLCIDGSVVCSVSVSVNVVSVCGAFEVIGDSVTGLMKPNHFSRTRWKTL